MSEEYGLNCDICGAFFRSCEAFPKPQLCPACKEIAALRAENEKLKERAQITECDLAKAVLFDDLVRERNALRAENEHKDKTIKAAADLICDGYVDDLLLAVKENEKKGEWDPSHVKEKSDALLTAQMVAAPRTPTAILARDEIRARLAALRTENEELLQGYFKGNSVNHWYTKAKCYGDMVHGAAIPLEKSGHPICSAGPDGAVGGIRRAIESLVSDRDALRAENEQRKKACESGAAILIECRDEITKRDAENATLQADVAYWHRHGLALRNGAARLLRDLEKGGGRSDDNLEAAADKALKALANLRIKHNRLQKALEWYRDQVSGCRKISQCGDAYRHRLDRDGGEIARVALAEEDHLAEALAALNKACTGREQVAGPCVGSETCECGADRKECENNRQVNKVHLNHVDGE